jgi:hypothetical protein
MKHIITKHNFQLYWHIIGHKTQGATITSKVFIDVRNHLLQVSHMLFYQKLLIMQI